MLTRIALAPAIVGLFVASNAGRYADAYLGTRTQAELQHSQGDHLNFP